jgi:hypothetical protein
VTIRTIRRALRVPLLAAIASAWTAAACRQSDPPPQAPSTASSNTPVRVSGAEKIVWDQTASNATKLEHYRYIVYVDDEPTDLADTTCGNATGTRTFSCTARLPKMLPGPHRLQLAIEESDGQKRRSPKSSVILVEVVTAKTPS